MVKFKDLKVSDFFKVGAHLCVKVTEEKGHYLALFEKGEWRYNGAATIAIEFDLDAFVDPVTLRISLLR